MTRPRVRDVARAAGVGASTVSRVMNGHPHISAGARERVLAAVERLGYTPDLNARSLRSGQTGAVSVLLPMTGTPFYDTLLTAVHGRLDPARLDLALFPLLGGTRVRRLRDPGALLYRADELLIASLSPDALYGGRPPFAGPVVLVDAHHPGYHRVSFDNVGARRLAGQVALEGAAGRAAGRGGGGRAGPARLRGAPGRGAGGAAGAQGLPRPHRGGPRGRGGGPRGGARGRANS